jgi:hypothetical protein
MNIESAGALDPDPLIIIVMSASALIPLTPVTSAGALIPPTPVTNAATIIHLTPAVIDTIIK